MDVAVRQRLADGQAAGAQATGRLQTRTAELLRAALHTEEGARTEHAARVSSGAVVPDMREPHTIAQGVTAAPALAGATASAPASTAEARVERALALVERIERFVRSGRPSLALTLRGGLPGQLEVQRVAPGAIALRLSSARLPSAGELGELRQALEARGLSVRSLQTRREAETVPTVRASSTDACSPCP
jgi:hypothetical protein